MGFALIVLPNPRPRVAAEGTCVCTVTLASGRVLYTTPDHIVFVLITLTVAVQYPVRCERIFSYTL